MTFSILFQNKPCNKNSNEKANQILVEIKGEPIKVGNAPTPSNKIDIGKLDWADAKFDKNLQAIDFTKITAEELKKILDETVNHSNCPLGSFYVSSKGCVSFENFAIVPQTPNKVDIEAIFNQPLPNISTEKLVQNPDGERGGSGAVLYIDPSKILQTDTGGSSAGDSMKMHHFLMSQGSPEEVNMEIRAVDEGEIPSIANSLETSVLKTSPNLTANSFLLNITSPEAIKALQSGFNVEDLLKILQLEFVDSRRSSPTSNSTEAGIVVHPRITKETVPLKLLLKLPGQVIKSTNGLKIEGDSLPIKMLMEKPEDVSTADIKSDQSRRSQIDADKLKVNLNWEADKSGSIIPKMIVRKGSIVDAVTTPRMNDVDLLLKGKTPGMLRMSSEQKPLKIEVPLDILEKLQGAVDIPSLSKLALSMTGEGRPASMKTVDLKFPLEFLQNSLKTSSSVDLDEGSSASSNVGFKLPSDFLQKSISGSFIAPNAMKMGLKLSGDGLLKTAGKNSANVELSRLSSRKNSEDNNLKANIDAGKFVDLVNPMNFLRDKAEKLETTSTRPETKKKIRGKKTAFVVHELPLISRKSAEGDKEVTEPPKVETTVEATTVGSTTQKRLIPKIMEAGKEALKSKKKVLSIMFPQIFSGRRNFAQNLNDQSGNNFPRPEIRFHSVDQKTLARNMHDEDITTPVSTSSAEIDTTNHPLSSSKSSNEAEITTFENIVKDDLTFT